MNKFEKYSLEKAKYSLELEKSNQLFQKARACIVRDNKVLVLFNPSKNKFTIPGGGVDEGESALEAVKREAFEESGFVVHPIKEVLTNYYEVPMEFEGEKFVSHRVEHIYICAPREEKMQNANGIDGEFDCVIKKMWVNFDELSKCGFKKDAIEKIKMEIKNLGV